MKRFLTIFISLLIIVSIVPQNVFATENESGSTDDTIYVEFTTNGDSVTITGLANSYISDLKIPETINEKPVTAIAKSAFENSDISSVEFPNTILQIGDSAFKNCTEISEITIPSKVEKIGNYAFAGCSGINGEIEVPNSVTNIGVGAFNGTKPTSMKLPFVGASRTATGWSGVFGYIFGYTETQTDSAIYQQTYYHQSGPVSGTKYYYYVPTTIKSVEITDATRMPENAFYNCSMLESITTNTGFSNISKNSFYNCSKIASFSINDETTEIGQYAFYGCAKLSEITIPSKVEKIGNYAFAGCSGINGEIEVPNSVTNIGVGAFNGTKPTSMKLPFVGASRTATGWSGVFGYIFGYTETQTDSAIYQQTYYHQSGPVSGTKYYYYVPTTIKSVEITDATRVSENAFYNCNMLSYVFLPDEIETIGSNCFKNVSDNFVLRVNKNTVGYTYAETNNITHSSTDIFTLNTNNLTLYRNEKSTIIPNVIMYNGKVDNNPNITWTSSDTNVVTVNNGVVSAVAPGSATITAKCDDKVQTVNVQVYFKLEKINFSQNSYNVDIGDNITLNVNYSPANTTDSKSLTWISSDESVATVNENGVVYAKSKGSTTITANGVNGVSTQCKVNVLVPIESLSLSKTNCTINKTDTLQLNANVSPLNTTDTISWSSSDTSIAAVDPNGLVTPYRSGNVTITVKSSRGKSASCVVHVLSPATSISIDKSEYNTFVGDKKQLVGAMEPYDVTDTIDRWDSSNKSVVTVSDNGTIEAVGKGSAIITVTTSNGKESSCTINVENDISKATIVKYENSVDYTGSPRYIDFDIIYNEFSLTRDKHYLVTYSNNVNAGIANVDIVGTNKSIGQLSFDFEIKKVDLSVSNSNYIPKESQYIYTGEQILYPGNLYVSNIELSNDDYIFEYKNNISPGIATLIISGQGNYCGTIEKNYTIEKRQINDVEISLNGSYEYTGEKIEPEINAIFNGKSLEKGKDYIIEYQNNINIGIATITIYGQNCFDGQTTKSFEIIPKKSDSLSCSLSQDSFVYNGYSQKPSVIIKDGEKTLEEAKDYTVVYSNNILVGKAQVTVSLVGNYTGEITKEFSIVPIDLSNIKVELEKYSYDYVKNTSFKPKATINYESIFFDSNSYDIDYRNNNGVGTAQVIVTFKGNYTGKVTTNYSIYPSANNKYITVFKGKKAKIKISSNSKIIYKSSNSKIAKVDSKGNVTGIKKGRVKITATSNEKSITVDVAVKNPYLNKKSAIIFLGDKIKLKVIGGSGKTKWKSNKKSVATVKNGKVKAKRKGTVTISAKSNGNTMKCKIKVKGPSIIIPKSIIIHKGDSKKISIKKKPKKMKLKWSSSNKKIVKVKNGKITGKSKGKAKITVIGTYKGKKFKTVCTVTVKKQKLKIYDIGDYQIGIRKVIKTKYNNQNILIVTYYFKNNSDSSNDFNWAIVDTLYQKGIELDRAYPLGMSGYDYSDQFREILPGATLDVQVAYKLRNTKSQVTAMLRELYDVYKENMAIVKINL